MIDCFAAEEDRKLRSTFFLVRNLLGITRARNIPLARRLVNPFAPGGVLGAEIRLRAVPASSDLPRDRIPVFRLFSTRPPILHLLGWLTSPTHNGLIRVGTPTRASARRASAMIRLIISATSGHGLGRSWRLPHYRLFPGRHRLRYVSPFIPGHGLTPQARITAPFGWYPR